MKTETMNKMCIILVMIIVLAGGVQGLGLGTLAQEFVYKADQTSSLTYYIVKDSGKAIAFTVDYIGELDPYVTIDYTYSPMSWYSTKGDVLNRSLWKEFNLTNITSATLKFYNKYSMEFEWDFGYVEISVYNGTNWEAWQHLDTTSTTDHTGSYYSTHPAEAPAYYDLNQSAITGQVSDWAYEEADLDPYTGNLVRIRFRYVTDNFVQERGWNIDDISIPEIGFFDDVDDGNDGWVTDGWTMASAPARDTDTKIPIILDFTIPNSFVYNGSIEMLQVTEIPIGATGIMAAEEISSIIVIIPSISKYIAPPEPSGGGDGGSQTQFTYYGNRFMYYAREIVAGEEHNIRPRVTETSITNIQIIVSSTESNARIIIKSLEGPPSNIRSLLDRVYKYFNIETGLENVEQVKIEFFVTSAWMEENNATQEDIVMMRFNSGQWRELPTEFIGMDGPNHLFEATSPGFSSFAISMKGKVPEPIVLEPGPTPIHPKVNATDLPVVYNDTSQLDEWQKLLDEKTEKEESKTKVKEETEEAQEETMQAEDKEEEPEKEKIVIADLVRDAVNMATGQEQEVSEERMKMIEKPIKSIRLFTLIWSIMGMFIIIIGVLAIVTELRKEK